MAKVQTQQGELAILPFPAEAPVRETLAFLTDVMITHNGSEDRIPLRKFARQSFQYSMPIPPAQTAEAFNTLYSEIRSDWAVPLWNEMQRVTVARPAFFIECETELYDIREGGLVLLFADCGHWQVLDVASVTAEGIGVTTPVTDFNRCWLLPVRIGLIEGSVGRTVDGYNVRADVKFVCRDLPFTPPKVSPQQYEGRDLYTDPWLLDGVASSRKLEAKQNILDLDLGPVALRAPWLHTRHTSPLRSVLDGAAEVYAYREWLFRRAGRYREFWMPTFERNMRVTSTGTIGSVLTIKSDSYLQHKQRERVAIHTDEGWLIRRVESALQPSEDVIQLTLNSPLNVAAGAIKSISYLGLNRLNADKIELNWIGNSVVETAVEVLEITP